MQIGIDSFAAAISDPATGLTLSPVERMHHLLEEMELADRVGLDVFGIGEHHRAEFLDSAPVVILSAAPRVRKISVSPAQSRFSAPPIPCAFFRSLRLSTSSPGAALKLSLVVVPSLSLTPSSACGSKTTTRFLQKNSIFC